MEMELPTKYTKVEPTSKFWKPETIGESTVGVYVRKEKSRFDDADTVYIIESNGEEIYLPTHAHLMYLMSAVAIGKEVCVIYSGTKTNDKGQVVKQYVVGEA